MYVPRKTRVLLKIILAQKTLTHPIILVAGMLNQEISLRIKVVQASLEAEIKQEMFLGTTHLLHQIIPEVLAGKCMDP